ncbi:MAG: Lrp/AsnC family transcriptional regulator [Tepidisphaeraceae bacterium]
MYTDQLHDADLLQAVDGQLLAAMQEQVPLSPRPFAAVARSLNLPESLVLERLRALGTGPHKVIRQIGAIFDSGSLGYRSTLVAAKVPEHRLASAAATINEHPGVSHNYRRDHDYNLWYTLAVAPDSRLGLEATAQILHQRCGAVATRLLPTLKMYKIGVKLDLGGGTSGRPHRPSQEIAAKPARHHSAVALSQQEIEFVRVLQRNLPIEQRPFDAWAREAGVTVDELLAAAEQFRLRGIMRRFSAVLRHRQLGFDANAMGVWIVPPQRQDAFGAVAAGFTQVSHCYLRPSYSDWPYNIYTMIHARQRAEGEVILKAIASATGMQRFAALYSTHEYKKVRVQYFTGDSEAWEAGVSGGEPKRENLEVHCE